MSSGRQRKSPSVGAQADQDSRISSDDGRGSTPRLSDEYDSEFEQSSGPGNTDNDDKSDEYRSYSASEEEAEERKYNSATSRKKSTIPRSRQNKSADPAPVHHRLLPRRGGTQTSRGLLTTHLQTMILTFESVQKQKVLMLKNKIKELQDIATVLKTENKTLRHNKKQNEREMTEIAAMISYHESNVKHLRNKVRESEISVTTQDSKTRKQNAVLVKLNDKYKEYQELLDNVDLQDSEALEEKIEEAEKELSEKHDKMTDLEQTLLSLKKKMNAEARKEQSRYHNIQNNIKIKREECQSLREEIMNKSKQIHRKNIYSRCTKKPRSFPAIGWYPKEDDEQPSNEKVQNWLKAIQHSDQVEKTHPEPDKNK